MPSNPEPNSQTAAGIGTGAGPVTQLDGVGFGSVRAIGDTEIIPNTGVGLLFEVAKIEKSPAIVVPAIVHMAISVTLKSGLFHVNLSCPLPSAVGLL